MATWYGYNLFLAYAFANHHHYTISLVLSSLVALAAFHSNVAVVGTRKGVLRVHSFIWGPQQPSGILTLALVFAGAFAAIHYNVSLIDHAAYSGMHNWQDSIYFSIVTLATVGYGDILPLSHVARWLCSIEIVCGFVILMVGLNVTLSVWLQKAPPGATSGAAIAGPEQKGPDPAKEGDVAGG
jgi:hypothetical protein